MYGWDGIVLLKHLLDEKLFKAAIARRLGVSRRIVYYRLKTGQLDSDLSALPLRQAAARRTKPALYKPLSALRLFAEAKAAGYIGGIVTRVRPACAAGGVQAFRLSCPPSARSPVQHTALLHHPLCIKQLRLLRRLAIFRRRLQ